MYEQVEKPKENASRVVSDAVTQKQSFGFVDNRPEVVVQIKLQEMATHHTEKKLHTIQKKGSKSMPIQLKELSEKEVNEIDKRAWKAAVDATAILRPEHQVVKLINGGGSDILDAVTRIRGRNNEILEVTYYPDNESLLRGDRQKRFGVMTALFNHELAYHGNVETIGNFNTDQENPDDEHHAMYDPARREDLLLSTKAILEDMGDPKARLAYINWWVTDIKEHTEQNDELPFGARRKANKWASETGRRLREIFGPNPKGRNDHNRSH